MKKERENRQEEMNEIEEERAKFRLKKNTVRITKMIRKTINQTSDRQVNPLGGLVDTYMVPANHIEVERILGRSLNHLQKMFLQVDQNLLKELVMDRNGEPRMFNVVVHERYTGVWSFNHHTHQ